MKDIFSVDSKYSIREYFLIITLCDILSIVTDSDLLIKFIIPNKEYIPNNIPNSLTKILKEVMKSKQVPNRTNIK